MKINIFLGVALLVALGIVFAGRTPAKAGEIHSASGYKVLAPIRHGNLTVFPVVAQKSHDTGEFLTLDEGLRSGDVVVTEYGSLRPMVRRRAPQIIPNPYGGAEVNRLVLVNNSKRPLLLLAGEIVTGGKQDRVIGKDRLVPAESDPIDLSVFCVEPGRWVGASSKFGAGYGAGVAPMAAPGVRSKAMADKDQAKVWSEVRKAQNEVVAAMPPSATETVEVQSTSSYARVMDNKAVRKEVDSIAVPIENSYRGLMKQLRDQNAVGVVVAVNGEIVWADIFASTDLLQKYWPKLVRSYASEAMVTRSRSKEIDEKSAQAFLDNMEGKREVAESEPGLYKHTEITGEGFKVFELTSLLPKTGFDLHLAKMAE
ncbi:MAG TPA: DUF6569 family protein [Terriglobales bacterium]|jgi:sulfur carrier protein ThiS|nr:DUF6569 family protein [Terriglobales bacterium]